MKNKLIIVSIIVLLVCVGFSGCTNNSTDTNTGNNNYNANKSTEPEPTVTYSYRLINGSEYEDIKAIITITNKDYEYGVSSSPYHWALELDGIRHDASNTYSESVNIMPNGTQTITIGFDLNIQFTILQEYYIARNHALANGRIVYTGPCPYMKLIE